jgi:hypothetical protein
MNRASTSLAFAIGLLVLGGCAKVAVRPEGDLPKPLIVATPAKVGVVVTPEAGNYTHKESRASVDYEADLGPSHKHLVEEIFKAEFTDAKLFESVDAARLEPGLMAIFEPRIEQFSFANAKETGGVYCAVTIRYNIAIYAPDGSLVDNLTLTGYGSGPAPKIGNGEEELGIAAYAAMRDAAAKFLTQFPGLDIAKPLLASHAIEPRAPAVTGTTDAAAGGPEMSIETVPINDPPVVSTATPSSQAPSSRPGSAAPLPAPADQPAAPPAPSQSPSQMAPLLTTKSASSL